MWAIFVLSMYGFGLAILGAVTLTAVPQFRLTPSNLFLFVFGGFVGLVAFSNAAALIAPRVLDSLGVRGDFRGGEAATYVVFVIGALVGGGGLVWVRARLQRR